MYIKGGGLKRKFASLLRKGEGEDAISRKKLPFCLSFQLFIVYIYIYCIKLEFQDIFIIIMSRASGLSLE